ncbi:MAG TPA: ATP-binding protein [Candidatus Acidoferrum sp.]|nr:ATP-binding protein [Candidatus Acidoferrum sp.]
MKTKTLRFRMMVLFCTIVSVMLVASYLAFWGLLVHEIPSQLNHQLQESGRLLIADVAAEPTARDIERLDIPGEFFELLDARGQVIQQSKNLPAPIRLQPFDATATHSVYQLASIGGEQSVRVAVLPFEQAGQKRFLAVAIPTFGTNRVLDTFGRIVLILFPISLLLTAGISMIYVGRSLAPITELTHHAASMARRVTQSQGFWEPLPVATPHDELGQLAETFNNLFRGVDSAVRQLRQFVTDASHELRTPIAVLHGETELLLSKPRTAEEYQKTLAVFDDELKKLTRMVEGLFTLSIADAGQLHLEFEPLYINEVLEEACALVSSRARRKGIAILRQLDQEFPYTGDEAFLHQLFLIFLDNAIKYSPEKSIIHVTLEQVESTIRVRFQDHGIGIRAEHLPFIFERFYRAAPSTSGESHSGGLGLAIAQAIVRAQGGSIECTSDVGVGSSFTVVLPLIPVSKIAPPEPSKQKLIMG